MELSFDSNLFLQTDLDSGSISMLSAIVHKFDEAGEYGGICYRGSRRFSTFRITVDNSIAIAQANIDLATLEKPNLVSKNSNAYMNQNQQHDVHFIVNKRGYVLFHVSRGAGGYSVKIKKVDENMDKKVFDSSKLDIDDIFCATLIRPGTYSVINEVTTKKAEVVVQYPKIGKTAFRPPDPIHMTCTSDSIDPKVIDIAPGQGQIYHFKTPSRIKIHLLKPNDGP